MKRSMRLLLLAGVLVLGLTAAANAADFVFKLGHIADPENPYAKGAEKFAQLVKEKTGGKVEVQVFPSSQFQKAVHIGSSYHHRHPLLGL